MTKDEIKKALYKEKPTAKKGSKSSMYQYYDTKLSTGMYVQFRVPLLEVGSLSDTEPAQLLIRWLV